MRSADGTRLRAWSNDGAGTPVLLCNGLGAPAAAWPRVVAPSSGFRVVTWAHRGLSGSQRPADPARIGVADHVADARAVLDAFGLPAAAAVGWSLGVNVAVELALQTPDRVTALLAVAGVPGGSFSSFFAPYGVPRRLRPALGRLGSRLLPLVGPALLGPAAEAAHPGALRAVLTEFSRHDWAWYRRLALAVEDHAPLDVARLRCPATFLAGRYDSLVDVRDVRAAARAVPGARLRELPGTHFLPLQYPGVMAAELRRLVGPVRERPPGAWT